jgi:hypothetical protein
LPTATLAPTPSPKPAPEPSATAGQAASGTIEIVDVAPKNATAGVETTFSVTVRYASANAGGCIIYAGANTGTSQRYALYDEYVLPDTSGTYTFSFTCEPIAWSDNAFGIYVNMSEYPHLDSWSPLDDDVYGLSVSQPPAPTPSPRPAPTSAPQAEALPHESDEENLVSALPYTRVTTQSATSNVIETLFVMHLPTDREFGDMIKLVVEETRSDTGTMRVVLDEMMEKSYFPLGTEIIIPVNGWSEIKVYYDNELTATQTYYADE